MCESKSESEVICERKSDLFVVRFTSEIIYESKSDRLRVHVMEVLRKVGRQPSLPIPIGGVVYRLGGGNLDWRIEPYE